jgi:hypothetical protein
MRNPNMAHHWYILLLILEHTQEEEIAGMFDVKI